jgi:hypothetical protein
MNAAVASATSRPLSVWSQRHSDEIVPLAARASAASSSSGARSIRGACDAGSSGPV